MPASDAGLELAPRAFEPLPLGSVRPTGWLRRQLRIQADGLSGHLDEFWPDIADSGWIGGKAEGWERGPYWLDGVVPLAFLLGDAVLERKVHRWMDHILTHQHDDGWLGPVRDTSRGETYEPYDPWPVTVALKAMTQYEAATGDDRVLVAAERFMGRLAGRLAERALFVWGRSRWADLVLSIHWLYEHTGQPWLLGLAQTVHDQGYDWRAHFADFQFTTKMRREDCRQETHVVNNAMAVKRPAVWHRQSHDPGDRDAVLQILDMLDTYHGQATGLFTGDEHYAGKSPSQGTELCAVVEYMFSLETALGILGKPRLADRLERIAFNALPATFKPDMWAHQYDQQANQVICKVADDPVCTNNGPDANIFGLEPNYGCCTANMHQGWPKFAASLWMRSPDNGLAAMAYAPCVVETDVAGAPVRIEVETDYPFDETIRVSVRAHEPVRFPLRLRVPGWAEEATVCIEGDEAAEAGEFHAIDRRWAGTSTVTLRLPMHVRAERRHHNSVAIHRGPLVYSLKIGEDWRLVGNQPPHGDWEVHPTTPWNYALAVDPDDPARSIAFERREIGDCPFSPDGAPLIARVRGRRLPQWTLVQDAAGPPPPSPVQSNEPLEELLLVPYGCTSLRVTEFPVLPN